MTRPSGNTDASKASHPAANTRGLAARQQDMTGTASPAKVQDELAALGADFPAYRIWRENLCGRIRYNAYRQQPGAHPHTVITADLAEMRAALEPSRYAALIPFQPTTPNIARMYSLLLGRKDHLRADRAAARPVLREYPEIADIARASRAFQALAVRRAAARGIAQFIDLGAGLPCEPDTHQTARAIAPGAGWPTSIMMRWSSRTPARCWLSTVR
jgi:hypothetical protein